jgi:asparagine synthase (glutamine-hydrolysing)
VDSAAILLAARDHLQEAPPSFTLGFDRRRYDERGAARGTAAHLGSRHRAFSFTSDVPTLLGDLVATTGEASADSSWLALADLCRQLPPDLRVMLAGDGGDEILLGYRRHALVALATRLDPTRRRGLARLAPLAPGWRRRQGLAALAEPPLGILADLAGLVSRRRWRALVRPELQGPVDPLTASYPQCPPDADPVAHAGLADLLAYLPGDLLPKADRASMRYGIEIWSPFLDHRVVELASSIPAALRIEWLTGKRPLRRLLRGRVPRAVLSRPKRGFGVPLASWLADGSYARFAREILGDRRELFGRILGSGDALPLLEAVQRGDASLASLVHGCVVLAVFDECFVNRGTCSASGSPPG